MKELLVYRHAKAEKASKDMMDHDRPLAPEGERQARKMGRALKEHNVLPDLVLSSDAVRALSTTSITLRAAACNAIVNGVPAFFDADPAAFVATIREQGGQSERIMIVGHNPALEELIERMVGEHIVLKTAYVARVAVAIADWSLIDLSGDSTFELLSVMRPDD